MGLDKEQFTSRQTEKEMKAEEKTKQKEGQEILEALKMLKSSNKTKTFHIYCICCMYLFILIMSLLLLSGGV